MNLALDFGEAEKSIEALSPLQGLVSRFSEAMQQDDSPVRAIRHQPARPARFAPFPQQVGDPIRSALVKRGIKELYLHQAAAVPRPRAAAAEIRASLPAAA